MICTAVPLEATDIVWGDVSAMLNKAIQTSGGKYHIDDIYRHIKEGYYNLISQGKQQSIIMLPKIGYYYMDSEVLTINKETGYIELYKHGQDKQYIVRVSLMFKERKNIHTLDEITDINETIYFFDNKIIIPSQRQIRLLSIKKNK